MYIFVSNQTKYLEYVIRLGVGPDGKEGREAVEERQGGDGDLPPPVSSLSWKTWKCNFNATVQENLEMQANFNKLWHVRIFCGPSKTSLPCL